MASFADQHAGVAKGFPYSESPQERKAEISMAHRVGSNDA